MCHNSLTENEQIEKCIENGMPHKIIKTIKYTMRKRIANEEDNQKQQVQQNQQEQKIITDVTVSNGKNISENFPIMEINKSNKTFVSKCPFGHGRISSPLLNNTSSTLYQTTTPSASFISEVENSNNINLYERFPQKISQLNTKINNTEHGNNDGVDNIGNKIATNLSEHFDEKLLISTKIYNGDILAKSTQLTRQFIYTMQQAIRRLQSNKIYTLLTKTSQPAHIVAIGILSLILLTVWPELINDGGTVTSDQPQTSRHHHHHHHLQHPQQQEEVLAMTTSHRQDMSVRRNDMLALIVYLGAFSTHFGSQIWMTFVSGLSLYFSLPRHMFGQCQQILFPKYFTLNATLSITMLILYVKFFLNAWTMAKCIQVGSLALTGAIEVLVRLYLAPPLLRLMDEKYKIEGTIGSGKEIGSLVQGDLIQCPHYQRIHKAFRRTHMTVAIGNMITMMASCLHLYFIAGQLQISIVY